MENIIRWTLNQQAANYILQVLDERPHKEVRQLMDGLLQQIQQQQSQQQEVPPIKKSETGESEVAPKDKKNGNKAA